MSQGNKNSFSNRCSELEVIRWKLESTKLECVVLWHSWDNCTLAVLSSGSQPSHPLLKASDRKKARQNRNVNKVILSYVNTRETSRCFFKLWYCYISCNSNFRLNFNTVFVSICFIILCNKNEEIPLKNWVYIKISHSSSGSNQMTYHQPIRGREWYSMACIPVLWFVDEKSFIRTWRWMAKKGLFTFLFRRALFVLQALEWKRYCLKQLISAQSSQLETLSRSFDPKMKRKLLKISLMSVTSIGLLTISLPTLT